jgi:hypothetical protein
MSRRSVTRALPVAVWALLAVAVSNPPPATAHANGAAAIRMVRVSHDGFPAHAEPSLAVNPRDPRNLLGAAQVFGPRQHAIGTFVSFDAGRTWRDNGPLPLPAGANWADDVTAAFDLRGAGFVAAMATRRTAQGLSQIDRGVYVWRTDDGGRTFHRPVAVTRGHFADHPWLGAGLSPGTAEDVYVAWSAVLGSGYDRGSDVLAFSRSVDGGRHFAAPRAIAAPPGGVLTPALAAGPGGMVAVAYLQGGGSGDAPDAAESVAPGRAPRASSTTIGGAIAVVRSRDGGLHFAPPTVIGYSPDPGVPTGPSLAFDPRTGTLYVAYTAQGGIAVARSAAARSAWAAPVRVAADPLAGQPVAFQPQVVVDGRGGVDVTYFLLIRGRIDLMLARSTTQGATFRAPLRLTPTPFDPALATLGSGGKHGPWWVGDYQGLAVWGVTLYPFWNDTRSGELDIFAATVSASLAR